MIRTLKTDVVNIVPKALMKDLPEHTFLFNPSYLKHNNLSYLTIRAFSKEKHMVDAYLMIWNDSQEITIIDLNDYFKSRLHTIRVSDPKLFLMNNQVCGTFNTGHTGNESNEIYFFKIKGKTISSYYSCEYNERRKIEKNWAFYSENNELFALYSLSPFIVLKMVSEENNQIIFEKFYERENNNFKYYSIGTPVMRSKGCYYFVAHKKIYKRGKRIYFGRPCKLTMSTEPKIVSKKLFLIHSLRSLFGSRLKLNKNLFSCTYFSGLYINEEEAFLSYGVNDKNWKIAKVNFNKLWQ